MAVSRHAALLLLFLALSALWPACRQLSLCEGESCARSAGGDPAAGGRPDPSHAGDGGDSGDSGAAGALQTSGASGAAGSTGHGEAGGANASCEGGLAECDGSALTHCETRPLFTVRHCGGCNQVCDGTCVLGKCKPAALVFTGSEVRHFVATSTAGYAISASLIGDDDVLVVFDLASGTAEIAMEGLPYDATLTLGADALYIRRADGEVLRVDYDGKLIAKEDVGYVTAFVATQRGAYLLQHDEGDGDEVMPTWSLWYRDNDAAEFEHLWQSERETRIESWSSYGLLLLEDDPWIETDEAEFTLVNETSIQALGAPPDGWVAALPRDGVAAVLALGEEGAELWWLREDDARRHALGVQSASNTLLLGETGIWLHLNENNSQYLQQFDDDGKSGLKIGLPYQVTPIFMSATHVWYSDADWLIDPSYLMRTEQAGYDDL